MRLLLYGGNGIFLRKEKGGQAGKHPFACANQ
jgi:hypothetical protein